jgi:hypothetical protein
MNNDSDKNMHFETRVEKGMTASMLTALFAMIGGWSILLGVGWFLLSQFSYPKTIAITMIVAGIIVKYSCVALMHYRARKWFKKSE